MDDKYVVIKRTDWDELRRTSGSLFLPDALDDAVVIRTRDIFAGPVLATYAGACQTAIEVIHGTDAQLSSLWVSDLEKVRDYFYERAREAEAQHQKRFPSAP